MLCHYHYHSYLSRSRNNSAFDSGSSSSDISEISERMRKTGLRQNTLDCDMLPSGKRLAPSSTEPRRASITIAPRYVHIILSYSLVVSNNSSSNVRFFI